MKGHSRDARCSFCGKRQDQVRKLVAGPGVYICDQCVALCNEVLTEASPPLPSSPTRGPGRWVRSWLGPKPPQTMARLYPRSGD